MSKFFLPKKDSSVYVELPREDSPRVTTKIIDVHVENFLEKLNEVNLDDQYSDFITSPRFLIGSQPKPFNLALFLGKYIVSF